jgi:hypothetical protein
MTTALYRFLFLLFAFFVFPKMEVDRLLSADIAGLSSAQLFEETLVPFPRSAPPFREIETQ